MVSPGCDLLSILSIFDTANNSEASYYYYK